MMPRFGPPESIRIKGDLDPHYGLEARMTFIQMLVNHMKEQDRLEGCKLPPWTWNDKYRDSEEDSDASIPLLPFVNTVKG